MSACGDVTAGVDEAGTAAWEDDFDLKVNAGAAPLRRGLVGADG